MLSVGLKKQTILSDLAIKNCKINSKTLVKVGLDSDEDKPTGYVNLVVGVATGGATYWLYKTNHPIWAVFFGIGAVANFAQAAYYLTKSDKEDKVDNNKEDKNTYVSNGIKWTIKEGPDGWSASNDSKGTFYTDSKLSAIQTADSNSK